AENMGIIEANRQEPPRRATGKNTLSDGGHSVNQGSSLNYGIRWRSVGRLAEDGGRGRISRGLGAILLGRRFRRGGWLGLRIGRGRRVGLGAWRRRLHLGIGTSGFGRGGSWWTARRLGRPRGRGLREEIRQIGVFPILIEQLLEDRHGLVGTSGAARLFGEL